VLLVEPSVIETMANERIAAIARTFEQELREQDREAAGVVRFAGVVVSQLTAAAYAIERCDELGAADIAQLYAPFEPFVSFATLG
jgi:hypothetical protein